MGVLPIDPRASVIGYGLREVRALKHGKRKCRRLVSFWLRVLPMIPVKADSDPHLAEHRDASTQAFITACRACGKCEVGRVLRQTH